MKNNQAHKAQATFEYIIIVGIIIIIVASSILIITKGPGPSLTTTQASNQYWLTADIGIISHQQEPNQLQLTVINNLYTTIRITEIVISTQNDEQTFQISETVEPQQQQNIQLEKVYNAQTQGSYYEYTIKFTYQDVEHTTQHAFSGQAPIVGKIRQQI